MSSKKKFDRSKFKATSADKLREQNEEVQKIMPKRTNDYLNLAKGSNILRIYPAHPGTSSYIFPKSTSYLPFKDDDGDIKKKPVFNAKVHSSFHLDPEKKIDIIDTYIEFAKLKIKRDEVDPKEQDKKIKGLYHWKTGISPKTDWVVYGDLSNKEVEGFGRIELRPSIKGKLDEIAMVEDVDQPAETDPFTDPDSGFAVKITYQTGDDIKPQDVYKAALLHQRPIKLTDAQLGELLDKKSLEELFVNSYTSKDFDRALEGLQLYDEENKIGVFELDEFLDICEELAELYPEAAEGAKEEDGVEEEDDEPTDELPFDKPEIERKRKERMKKAAKSESEEEEEYEEESEDEAEMDYPSKTEKGRKDAKAKAADMRSRIEQMKKKKK